MNLLDILKNPAARIPRPARVEPVIEQMSDPARVVIPLEYHAGTLLQPAVEVGEEVARNQVIACSERGNCIHASIGGKVAEISRIWTAGGNHVPAVVIDRGAVPDFSAEYCLGRSGLDPATSSRLELLRAGGVISPWTTAGGERGSDEPIDSREIRHMIIVGHEAEPTQHVQEILLQDRGEELKKGLRLMRDVAPNARLILTVPRALAGRAAEMFGDEVKIVPVAEEYRRRLIRVLVGKLTGTVVPSTRTYRSRGIAVMPVEMALAAQAALSGRPHCTKVISVSGPDLPQPRTLRVPLGTRVADVLEFCGLEVPRGGRVLAGGPMQGTALYSLDTPVDKQVQGIHLIRERDLSDEINLNCVNCGRCVQACPVNLQVHLIGRCVEFDFLDQAAAYHPEACLECGLCAYVCPARRPLVQLVNVANNPRRKTP